LNSKVLKSSLHRSFTAIAAGIIANWWIVLVRIITCADPATLEEAQRLPERYDLVRNRMGGWSEFFVAMFPHLQEQHKRRPIFEASEDKPKEELATPWRPAVRAEAD
jgi:hypothetical protein